MKKFLVFSLVVIACTAAAVLVTYRVAKNSPSVEGGVAATVRSYPYVVYAMQSPFFDTTAPKGKMATYDLVLADLRTKKSILLTSGGFKSRFCVSKEGLVYYSVGLYCQQSIWVIDLKKRTYRPFFSADKYISGDGYAHYADAPAISPDGKQIVFEGNPELIRTIWAIDPEANGQKILTHNFRAHCGSPEISADGRIAFDMLPVDEQGKVNGNFALWVMRDDGSRPQQVFSEDGKNSHRPVWRPEGGRWLLFYSMIGDKYGIRAGLLDSKNNLKPIVKVIDDGNENFNPRWSPDGKCVIYQSMRPVRDTALGLLLEDYDIFAAEFHSDLPSQPLLVVGTAAKEINPFWVPFSENEVWGNDLVGYLSGGIMLDTVAVKPKRGI